MQSEVFQRADCSRPKRCMSFEGLDDSSWLIDAISNYLLLNNDFLLLHCLQQTLNNSNKLIVLMLTTIFCPHLDQKIKNIEQERAHLLFFDLYFILTTFLTYYYSDFKLLFLPHCFYENRCFWFCLLSF